MSLYPQRPLGVDWRRARAARQPVAMTPVVVAWDPQWSAHFAAERVALVDSLGPWLVQDVHHVGSTAIPGMPSKPIIDMIAGISHMNVADMAESALTQLGYARRPHRVDAALFVKIVGHRHTHHLHLTVPGSDLWRERLAFRDALRHDPALVEQYSALKAELLRASGGRLYDAPDKREFVRAVLAGAGVHLRDGLHTNR